MINLAKYIIHIHIDLLVGVGRHGIADGRWRVVRRVGGGSGGCCLRMGHGRRLPDRLLGGRRLGGLLTIVGGDVVVLTGK